MKENKDQPMKDQEENFLQVGRTIQCGACHPKDFPDCRVLPFKCDCECHDGKPNDPIEEKVKEFRVELEDVLDEYFPKIEEGEEKRAGKRSAALVLFAEAVVRFRSALTETCAQARREAIREVMELLKNWTRFTCHTREEHARPDSDCPGWTREDDRIRGVILEQIEYQLKLILEKLKLKQSKEK